VAVVILHQQEEDSVKPILIVSMLALSLATSANARDSEDMLRPPSLSSPRVVAPDWTLPGPCASGSRALLASAAGWFEESRYGDERQDKTVVDLKCADSGTFRGPWTAPSTNLTGQQ
jgi:hypothetical protein